MALMHRLPRLRVVERQEYLVAKCAGKRVLHLGAIDLCKGQMCGLHRQLMRVTDGLIGIDIDRDGIEQAKSAGIHNIQYGDLEKLEELDIGDKFDVIAAGGVIEHLSNPGLFLEGIKKFFGPHTEMILTTPNAFSIHRFLLSLVRLEYVHPDHVCYYSYITLKRLLQRHGFVIEEELAHVLEGRLRKLRALMSRANFHFGSGLIFVLKV